MPAFNAEQNIAARNGRISHLHMSYAITFFGNAIALVTVLAFGPTASFAGKLAVAMLIIATALYGVLSSKEALDELAVLNEDGAQALKGTDYATHLRAIPTKLFSTLTVLTDAVVAVVLLIALLAA